ncbi:hypothetical protein TNCT_643341 [Trichonephila clavata]|uniref:Uncharacterized protein n=1 Tax=Trichonephila clavata TaxID=2740835 RepID=A0A8X6G1Z5_TRICU|nr:hypothetical protein TNCT_643341 [Trichonephila clavata]
MGPIRIWLDKKARDFSPRSDSRSCFFGINCNLLLLKSVRKDSVGGGANGAELFVCTVKMVTGEERRGLPLGLADCFFAGNLNPSSSTEAILRVSISTSDLGILLALLKVLFSAGAATLFRFEVNLQLFCLGPPGLVGHLQSL